MLPGIADKFDVSNSIECSANSNKGSSLLIEAYRRSNMICLQLYTKDLENLPGESAASSILSRHTSSYDTKVTTWSLT